MLVTHHYVRQTTIYLVNMAILRNQLRYRGNLVKQIKKDEKRYYEELVDYSRRNLMLFPYHLSDVVVKVGRKTRTNGWIKHENHKVKRKCSNMSSYSLS